MNEAWKSFIQTQGAVLEGERVRDFGRPAEERMAAAHGDILADLSDLSFMRARGVEAKDFLNGQLSNDVKMLDASHSQLAAWCNPKGRMLVIFRLFRRADDYLLQLPAVLQENILKRLRMFVMRSKVVIDSADNELSAMGLAGPKAEQILRAIVGFVPAGVNTSETRNDITIISMPDPQPRYEIVAPTATLIKLWSGIKPQVMAVGPSVWAWLDIMAGIPTILPETHEEFVPQMANLELISGVNFKKGCYPGQEIVARMQYLGKLKQRMFRAHVQTTDALRPGTPIYAPDFPGQSAGMVVNIEPASNNHGYDMLAVIQISSASHGELHLASESGPLLTLQSLPYSVPSN
ncbi:MAG: folate-binding protein YgfZ [Gammaproteobacteria bacterium]|nr:folate-binding protein YgfZ [Gammaproteobacteria bacterium]